jgi:hypothetical protein
VEGNVYTFTLSDDRIVMFTCDSPKRTVWSISGDGLESDAGGNYPNRDDCISGVCYIGDNTIREGVWSDTCFSDLHPLSAFPVAHIIILYHVIKRDILGDADVEYIRLTLY